jgi:glucose-6-phosphate 1-dehydrogenase
MSFDGAEPTLFVILGGTGDLARRKLLPALVRARAQGYLGKPSVIVGVARGSTIHDDAGFQSWAREGLIDAGLLMDEESDRWLNECVYFQPLGAGHATDYQILAKRITALEQQHRLPGNRILYLALPPAIFPGAIEALASVGLHQSAGWTRLVNEKPFGHDLESAKLLNKLIVRHFPESQVYRIDHYLGKVAVQNLLLFRFANGLFESIWNRDRIDNVQITAAEELGVEQRAGYYDKAGALRDMVQNHLTQLLTLVAMEIPAAFEADMIRDEKLKVLRSMCPIATEDVVFGQYEAGTIDGRQVPGYREESGVRPDSRTETFVGMKVAIDNERWRGVPFYLRTGKRLSRQITEIVITFRQPSMGLFHASGKVQVHSNVLVMRLQPNEGISLFFDMKRPERRLALETQSLHFRYQEAYHALPAAYETLILDMLAGDQTRFVRADVAEASWQLYAPLLKSTRHIHHYPAGTWGPREADIVLEREGRAWRNTHEE